MPKFKLHSKYQPTGDQPSAIADLCHGLDQNIREQTLLGVTGSGKTFTMANIIKHYQKPTLILAHNKTLAAQLYSEFREFFPENEVHYFVSYFDYYQPEAYIASSDTYIEKDSAINDEIDRLRHGATVSLLTRPDTIIVASVSCIYGIGSPDHYTEMSLHLRKIDGMWKLIDTRLNRGNKSESVISNGLARGGASGGTKGSNEDPLVGAHLRQDPETPVVIEPTRAAITQSDFLIYLVAMQYHRNDIAFERGNFRVMGDTVDVYPASGEYAYRFEFGFDELETVKIIDPLTAEILEKPDQIFIFPNTWASTSSAAHIFPALQVLQAC